MILLYESTTSNSTYIKLERVSLDAATNISLTFYNYDNILETALRAPVPCTSALQNTVDEYAKYVG